MSHIRYALTILLGAALGMLGCATETLQAHPWFEARTPNFVILSSMPKADVLELARDLETFRSVVEFATAEEIPPSRVPLRVYAFDGPGTYRYFKADNQTEGYFASTMRQSTIVLGGRSAPVEAGRILQHEYVHFLLRNRGHYAYPPWYDEGFADFLSTVEVGEDGVDIGLPLRHRVSTLSRVGWIHVGRVLALRSLDGMRESQMAAFYAESWALVHYLNFRRKGKGANTREELTRYLRELRAGTPDEQAVLRAFGVGSRTLNSRLREYVEVARYPYVTASLEGFDRGAEPKLRVPTSTEIASELGWLSIAIGKYQQAERQYLAALAGKPGDARALAGLAGALAGQERWEESESCYRKALAAGPDDALVHLDYGNYLHARAKEETDASVRAQLAQRARKHYVRSWKLDDSIPETYAAYGSTFLLAGQDAARGRKTLERAQEMLPSSREIKIALARLYAKLNRREEARQLVLVLSTWAHSQEEEEEFQALLGEVRASSESEGASRGVRGASALSSWKR